MSCRSRQFAAQIAPASRRSVGSAPAAVSSLREVTWGRRVDMEMCLRALCVILVAVFLWLLADTAAADVFSASNEYSAPPQPASFTPEAPITQQGVYFHTFGVTYDETAGIVTVSWSYYEPDFWRSHKSESELSDVIVWLGENCESVRPGSARVTIGNTEAPEAPAATLSLNGTRGSLQSTTTYANGVYTVSFGSSLLVGQHLRCFTSPNIDYESHALADETQAQAEAVEAAQFTPAAASAALRTRISSQYHGAAFPSREGNVCPELYTDEERRKYSECFAEFRTGSVWNLVYSTARFERGAIRFPKGLHDSRWRRRWMKCSLHGWRLSGTLIANNGCTRGPQSDAYFIAIEASPFPSHVRSVGWQFTESAGFTSIGRFAARKSGRTYVFTNAVGDSFRYTP